MQLKFDNLLYLTDLITFEIIVLNNLYVIVKIILCTISTN